MARLKFLEDFDYKPTRQSTVAYLAGWEGVVKRECADQAIAAGKARAMSRSRKAEKAQSDGAE